jgi:hypothetical protein
MVIIGGMKMIKATLKFARLLRLYRYVNRLEHAINDASKVCTEFQDRYTDDILIYNKLLRIDFKLHTCGRDMEYIRELARKKKKK